MTENDLKLYAITDRSWLKENENLEDAVEKAIIGGATMIQLREKKLSGDQLKGLALRVQAVCRAYKVPFIINDDPELAKEIDADGVHVGLSDMDVKNARALLGKDKIVGATAKTIEQAKEAERKGADYLGSGAIFGTTTKADAKKMSKALLTEITKSVNIPVVAIGGIDETNVEELKGIPIKGIAVVSGIFAKENKEKAARNLKNLLFGKPLIQCITNNVTVNSVANVLLQVKASPIMAHNPYEVAEVQQKASALLLNLGATDDYEAMLTAASQAAGKGHTIVIDPVGVGTSSFRRDFLKGLLNTVRPTCIRGNFSEIKAILKDTETLKGLDDEESMPEEGIVLALAKKTGSIVVASGRVDIISDGTEVIKTACGHEMEKYVTGAGCMMSAVIAAYLAGQTKPSLKQVQAATEMFGSTAEFAAAKALKEGAGPMNFYTYWLDAIYNYC